MHCLDKLLCRIALAVVAQNQTDFAIIFKEVFLQQRQNMIFKNMAQHIHGRVFFQGHKISVSDGMFPIIKDCNALIHGRQHFADGHTLYADICQQLRVRQHLAEAKTAPESRIYSGNGTVRGIHGANQVDIFRNAERFLGIRQKDTDTFRLTLALGRLNQGNQFPEDFGNIATVDFVDDEDITCFTRRSGRPHLLRLHRHIFFDDAVDIRHGNIGHPVNGG